MVFLFPTKMKLSFCQKSKDDLLPKNTFEDNNCGITEKDDTHSRIYVFCCCFFLKKN